MEFLGPGLYSRDEVSHDRYHADPCALPSLSSHIAQIVVGKSAGHAALAHPRMGGQRFVSSDAMDTGSILHGLILGGGQDLVEVDAKDWRTNAAKEAREAATAEGKIAILKDKLVRIKSAAERVRKCLPKEITLAKTEVTAIWESNGCPCRCRIDDIEKDFQIYDLKFVEDASVSTSDRNVSSSGYYIQAAANIDAIETLVPGAAGRVNFTLVFIEWENPSIGIKKVRISGQLLDVGRSRWNRAKGIWSQCLSSNRWPGYTADVVDAQCPAWLASEEFDTQLQGQAAPF